MMSPKGNDDPFAGFFVDDEEANLISPVGMGGNGVHELDEDLVVQLLGLVIGDEEYGIDIHDVQEIIKVPVITRVPRVARHIMGIFSLRGTIVPVVDLRALFGFHPTPLTRRARVLVMRVDGEPMAFVVDAVTSVARVFRSEIVPKPAMMQRGPADLVQGTINAGESMLIVLDAEALFERVDRS